MPLAEIHTAYADGPVAAARSMAEALASATIVRIRPGDLAPADPKRFWAEAGAALGRIDARHEDSFSHRPFEAQWWDIRYDPDKASVYRHSATAQPLHTDNAFHDSPPNAALFYCERASAQGGETVFLDGETLCAVLRDENPALLNALRTTRIHFSRGEALGQTTTIIGERAGRPVLNWNYYRVTRGQGPDVEKLREEFFAFLRDRFADAPELIRVRLAAGEAMIFKEQRVIHGRNAFDGDAENPRLIQTMNLHLPPSLD